MSEAIYYTWLMHKKGAESALPPWCFGCIDTTILCFTVRKKRSNPLFKLLIWMHKSAGLQHKLKIFFWSHWGCPDGKKHAEYENTHFYWWGNKACKTRERLSLQPWRFGRILMFPTRWSFEMRGRAIIAVIRVSSIASFLWNSSLKAINVREQSGLHAAVHTHTCDTKRAFLEKQRAGRHRPASSFHVVLCTDVCAWAWQLRSGRPSWSMWRHRTDRKHELEWNMKEARSQTQEMMQRVTK